MLFSTNQFHADPHEANKNLKSHNITATVALINQDPCSLSKARYALDKDEWEQIMRMEVDLLHSNEVWELVEPLADLKVVGSKWIFK